MLSFFMIVFKMNPAVLCVQKESNEQQTDLWWVFLPPGLLQLAGLSFWRVSMKGNRRAVTLRARPFIRGDISCELVS